MRHNRRTLRDWRLLTAMLLALLTVLPLGKLSLAQPREQELFKVRFGDHPQQLRMVLFYARDDAEEGEEDPPYGGVDNFCVSWDGQLFYFCDSMRATPKLDDENTSAHELNEGSSPWIQVYNRRGEWVRIIKVVKGRPSYFRVDRDGRLYVGSDEGVEVYNPDGSYNKTLSEQLQRSVRTARVQYNLEEVIFREVDSLGRIYFWVFLSREAAPEGESRLNNLLIVSPDGQTRLVPVEIFNPLGIDRYRGEIITANYQRPFTEGYIRQHETVLYDVGEQREIKREQCNLYTSLPYKVVDSSGEVSRTFLWQVDVAQHAPNLFDAYVFTYRGWLPDNLMTDNEGRLYRIYLASRIERHAIPTASAREWLTVDRGFAIVEFDSQGRFRSVRARNLPLETDFANRLWDVDRDGNVYWVEFQADHLRVMMSPKQ